MIFFYIRKPEIMPDRVKIPMILGEAIPGEEWMLVPWNWVDYEIGGETISITDVGKLQECIEIVAKQDDVCKTMNQNAFDNYGIYFFVPDGKTATPENAVNMKDSVDRIFREWAHPMIGNIANSPVVRPQDWESQYSHNWGKVPSIFHGDQLRELNQAMGDIERSGHDQVRICGDLVTLARAILGEITTLAVRRIEKLFALDLCSDELLAQALEKVLVDLLTQIEVKEDDQKHPMFEAIKQVFVTNGKMRKTQYHYYYFEHWIAYLISMETDKDNPKPDAQWDFFMMLVAEDLGNSRDSEKLKEALGKYYCPINEDKEIDGMINEYCKLPVVIRRAETILAFRYLGREIQDIQEDKVQEEKKCTIQESDKGFVFINCPSKPPELETEGKRFLIWSWNRDETALSTQTFRKHLMPLWAGPSGHAHGVLSFLIKNVTEWNTPFEIGGKQFYLPTVVLTAFFIFWRLYYDKRISAVHTIAETYDASIWAFMQRINADGSSPPSLPACGGVDPVSVTGGMTALDVLLLCESTDKGIINSIRLGNSLKKLYYDKLTGTAQQKYDQLKKFLDDRRDAISAKYFIPLWSKPLIPVPLSSESLLSEVSEGRIKEGISLPPMKIFIVRNIKTYIPRPLPKPDEELLAEALWWSGGQGDGTDMPDIPAGVLECLYRCMKNQGSTICIGQELFKQAGEEAGGGWDGSEIIYAWDHSLLTECLSVENARLTEFTEEGFTVNGTLSRRDRRMPWGEDGWPVSVMFGRLPDKSPMIEAQMTGSIEKISLGQFYPGLPETVKKTPVLSELVFSQAGGIRLHEWGVSFNAHIGTQAAFWDGIKAYLDLEEELSAECEIRTKSGETVFTARIRMDTAIQLTEKFVVTVASLTLLSGMDPSSWVQPRFECSCRIGQMKLTMAYNVDGHLLLMEGDFDQDNIFTLKDMWKLFGLPDDVFVIPEELSEQLLGNVGLYHAGMELGLNSLSVNHMEFTIGTKKPWELLGGRISFEPYLFIEWNEPFDTRNRKVKLQASGIWKLGSTHFYLSVFPDDGEIQASMQEGEVLDVTAALDTFIQGVTLPQVTLQDMSLNANYKEGSYEISLAAGECLEFTVCGTQMGIKDLSFMLRYGQGAVQEAALSGMIRIGVVSLAVSGEYTGPDDWKFTACWPADMKLDFSGFWRSAAQTFTGLTDASEFLPDKFLSFQIGDVQAAYSTKEKCLELYVVLDQITVTDHFSIDSVLAAVRFKPGALESLKLCASFHVAEIPLMLGVEKEGGGYSIRGGTGPGKSLPLGKMLTEFVDDVLGWRMSLAQELLGFTIEEIGFVYGFGSKESFTFDCSAQFDGEDPGLKKLFGATAHVCVSAVKKAQGWQYGFDISCGFMIGAHKISCSYQYDAAGNAACNAISLRYEAQAGETVLCIGELFAALGITGVSEELPDIAEIGISGVELEYDFSQKCFRGVISFGEKGNIEVEAGAQYRILVSLQDSLSLGDIPVVGKMAERFLKPEKEFSVSDMQFYILSDPEPSKDLPAGAGLSFRLCGENHLCKIYEPVQKETELLAENTQSTSKTVWMQIHKTVAVVTIHRLGVGLDGSYVKFLLDADLNLSPFTVSLLGAGVGVKLSDISFCFMLEGFGLSFQNSMMALHGELRHAGGHYQGALLVQIKDITVFAVVDYSERGSLLAYGMASGMLGGPPAFQITGIALGFGYQKRLILPDISRIEEFPLVKGAVGRIHQGSLLEELEQVVCDSPGENFGAAGIRFQTFGIADSFVLLTVNFGKAFEIALLGISEITMPPKCPSGVSPILHARLALKAVILPDEGVAAIEARLAEDSYILSKDCHLTGGFAFYMWFDKTHKGDFVVTLGGYHPSYLRQKPSHYPDVPRLGFLWKIGSCLQLDGEMYFALTPSAVMAGGRLNMTFAEGCIRAWFVAKVDFLVTRWKPFCYEAEIGITVGLSLRVKLLFVTVNLTLELSASLHVWGPDFSGIARIKCWVISFNISFGAKSSPGQGSIGWEEFCTSFLPSAQAGREKEACASNTGNKDVNPLRISFTEGLSGELKTADGAFQAVRGRGVTLQVDSALAVTAIQCNGQAIQVGKVSLVVKPMGDAGKSYDSRMTVTVTDRFGTPVDLAGAVFQKNLPSALWGGEGELVYDVPCGVTLVTVENPAAEFPQNHWISMEDLYQKGTVVITDAFIPLEPGSVPEYTDVHTVSRFAQTLADSKVAAHRISFLKSLGVDVSEEIDLSKYAAGAESYLDEEVLIAAS